ncbi:hypothetical protein EIP91_009058 [Steccherinum ochraceum]|uniref:F-box domain-containing protein n=1 Tax=Steccherinum ochraceum TaxID=92696 RepID=A0A4R0RF91_9APHY|nr:hypothetical protein EIP91_009058 [Steccherinum ochraceum]
MADAFLFRLPVELSEDILALACNADGGLTGSRLSLVCRAFRAFCVGTGVDLRCAYVRRVERMVVFLEMLKKRERSARRVKSLMLVERGRVERDETLGMDVIADVVNAILAAISPEHLQVLSVYLPFWQHASSAPAVIPADFPELLHLSISGPYNTTSFSTSRIAPRLTRLHIHKFDELPPDFGAHLSRISPRLIHFKISNTHSMKAEHAQALKAFRLSKASSSDPFPPTSDAFPPTLRQIAIEFAPLYHPAPTFVQHAALNYYAAFDWHASIHAINSVLPVPQNASSVDFDASLVILPVPQRRTASDLAGDEERDFEAFKADWECYSSRDTGPASEQ